MSTPADLDRFKRRLGTRGDSSDALLAECLDTAIAAVEEVVYVEPDGAYWRRHPQCVEAVMLIAHRLYTRRNSPEGVSGWGDLGVVRVTSRDPDVEALLERHIDYSRVGVV